jgi:BirA family transcriptional regulator, biotin operon repressor / biotin---[acetyl-CoA-carboxylase] ligase
MLKYQADLAKGVSGQMTDVGDHLTEHSIRMSLGTRLVGQNVVYFESVDSTNRVAKELARNGAAEGTLVIADSQSHGRGRLGRQWLAPPDTSLLMSLIFRPDLTPLQAARVTMVSSLAVVDAIEDTTSLTVRIKWPNDIMVKGRKLGGILAELGFSQGTLSYVVVGLGLNVNVSFDDQSAESPADAAPDTARASLKGLADRSTSLSQEIGRNVPRLTLLCKLLASMENRYEALLAGHIPNSEWGERLETLGQRITVTAGTEVVVGRAEDVDEDGALLLRLDNGAQTRILVGDVTLRSASEI